MKKSELLTLLNNISDDGSIDEVLQGTDLVKGFITSGLTLDAFKNKAGEKEFKAYLDSLNDKHFEKALKTWRENNLEKELEPFIKEKYPDLIKDPVQKQIAELQAQLEKERVANTRKDLLSQAMQYASENKLPSKFVERFLDEDLEKTKINLDSFKETFDAAISGAVNEKLEEGFFNPGNNLGGLDKNLGAIIAEKFNNDKSPMENDPWGLNNK